MFQGTHPFIAAEVLKHPEKAHRVCDDIESFYYVLLYVCLMYEGPNDKPRAGGIIPYFLNDWLQPEKFKPESLGDLKVAHKIMDAGDFEVILSAHMSDDMKPLIPCLKKLHDLLRTKTLSPATNDLKHEDFIAILDDAIATLPDGLADLFEDNRTTIPGQHSGVHMDIYEDDSDAGENSRSSKASSSKACTMRKDIMKKATYRRNTRSQSKIRQLVNASLE